MKKNISINISGVIFHIEEDGYDTLRKYLDSINSYFGTFEDSSEILADIESRIAEIFLSRLNDGKQIITLEDVQALTATMGSVSDFKAAEEPDNTAQESQSRSSAPGDRQEQPKTSSPKPKRLMRDQRRKILGGVCAGLGNYFSIDPVWPRLLFALLVAGTYGIFLLIYVVLWITLPFSHDLEDEPSVKKMYRDPDGKVIGGVAGGVAAFFGIDVVVVRVLFGITTIFFGTGLVVYIILWIALPEAKTITEKMKMQGEPVTLSNIESSVKKSINEKEGHEESTLARILLFPFRVIAAVLQGIARILGPLFRVLIDIVRVAFGLVFTLSGTFFILSLIFVSCVLLGLFSFDYLSLGDIHVNAANIPLQEIRRAFPTWTVIFAFLMLVIPGIFIVLIGTAIIGKRPVVNTIAGWALFAVFVVSVIFLGIRVPQLVYSFKEEGEVKVEKIFGIQATPVLKLRETGLDDYKFTELSIGGYDGKDLKLIERFGAQGYSRLNARENAMLIGYNTEQKDSVITFDSNLTFRKGAPFSFQRLEMDLLIPYNKPFSIDPEMWNLIRDRWRFNYEGSNELQTYKVTREGNLECISCPPPPKDRSGIADEDQFGLKDFTEIEMTGIFNLIVRQGNEYAITMTGNDSRKKLYSMKKNGETLEVKYAGYKKSFWKDNFSDDDFVTMTIVLPDLEKLTVTGAGKVKLSGFNQDEAKINLTGAMVLDAKISVQRLYIDIEGPVVMELDGNGNFMEATVSKAAQLKASSYDVNHAIIEAKELSQARVSVSGTLEMDKDISSTIKYSGTPEVIKRD